MVNGTSPNNLTNSSTLPDQQRQRERNNRVQFNLDLSTRNVPQSTNNIPDKLKLSQGVRDFSSSLGTSNDPFYTHGSNGIPLMGASGNQRRGLLSTITQSQNVKDNQDTSLMLSQLSHPKPDSGLSELNRRTEDSLTKPNLKSKMKSSALNRRNLSKVAYTYQAVIRPTSPGYMSSTVASRRNRSSKLSNLNNSSVTSALGTLSSSKAPASSSTKNSQKQRHFPSESPQVPSTLRASQSTKTIGGKSQKSHKGRKRSRFRLSVSHHDMTHHSSTASVVMKEKFLMKIFSSLGWNELLAIRWTCKKWYEIISSETRLQKEGVIVLRRNLEGMAIFNKSLYVWTQFGIFVSVVFDFTDPAQNEFWAKHGKTMTFLEIRNSSMTLSALVEILSRCTNLEHFSLTWTAEMFTFNSEMIKKYYGIHFRNGTFVKLRELRIDKSYFLTDNALWSLLKWCGGSIHKLALTCGPEEQSYTLYEDTLSRLKPRWSIEPIQNYSSRFGYSGNFKYLDFSGSNLNSEDLKTLARTEKLSSLMGIRLSSCKINDEAIVFFIEKKGANLEELYVDNTQISEKAFESTTKFQMQKLKSLNISGKKSTFRSLDFLNSLKSLEEFVCSDTPWLTYSTLARPLEGMGSKNCLKKLDISSSNNIISRVDQRMNKIWFSHLTNIVPRLTELNLNYCGTFGNDDNFKAICTNIPTMEKLCVRDWVSLTDEALVGMTFDDIIKQYDDVRGFWKSTDTPLKISPVICNLKNIKFLDFGGCKKLTDICIQFAIIHLPRLIKLGLDKSQVTDAAYNLLITKSPTLEKLCLTSCEHIAAKPSSFTRPNGRLLFIGKL